jgi:hypothetical protein
MKTFNVTVLVEGYRTYEVEASSIEEAESAWINNNTHPLVGEEYAELHVLRIEDIKENGIENLSNHN